MKEQTREAAVPAPRHRWFAAMYDRMNASEERGRLGTWRDELLAGLHGDVLEIGAGTGANFAHYPADVHVVALEPDPYMAARAKDRLRPNIELREAPGERLPLADASFDSAVTTLVLCTVRDVPRTLAEVRRVLRPAGELRFIEHVRGERMLGRIEDLVQPVYGWFAAGCHANRRTERALRDAGFQITQLRAAKLHMADVIIGRAISP